MHAAGQMKDEWNMKCRIVYEEPVRIFAMLAQALAVIAAEHDQCVAVQAFVFEKFDQPPNLRVCECDFAVI